MTGLASFQVEKRPLWIRSDGLWIGHDENRSGWFWNGACFVFVCLGKGIPNLLDVGCCAILQWIGGVSLLFGRVYSFFLSRPIFVPNNFACSSTNEMIVPSYNNFVYFQKNPINRKKQTVMDTVRTRSKLRTKWSSTITMTKSSDIALSSKWHLSSWFPTPFTSFWIR